MSSDSKPNYVYKIVPSSSPVPELPNLPERLPVSDLDQSSGFIHLSTASQIPSTLKFFFKDDTSVYILRLPYDVLEDQKLIRWEDPKAEVCGPRGGEGMFPHLYNGLKLGKEEIERIEVLEKREEGWEDAIVKAETEWLVW
ncbi:hypothetical protein K435DRAFT_182854 [Dendrothele bispora CBS 962.96]|uniref:DUF952-domain-containing protein n=1 Tax=Dendrothele bispora (strain CBS 962.96) TaxID=1314807 RepID=A0A4S8LW08_DENBC|nr:hypothetical protein K435DRAFT_182854 [Dendrothele bispora CBS 962.96]